MKFRYIYIALLSVFSIIMYGQNSQQKHYIFFLHNKFLESHSLEEKHPKYGVAEYEAILHQLKDKNTVVISEKRKADTNPSVYAQKVAKQIDSLMKKGIPAGNILSRSNPVIERFEKKTMIQSRIKFYFLKIFNVRSDEPLFMRHRNMSVIGFFSNGKYFSIKPEIFIFFQRVIFKTGTDNHKF